MYSSICASYISLLGSDILKKHNYEPSFNCMMELSRAYDSLPDNTDEKLMLKLKGYGMDSTYWLGQDEIWRMI